MIANTNQAVDIKKYDENFVKIFVDPTEYKPGKSTYILQDGKLHEIFPDEPPWSFYEALGL